MEDSNFKKLLFEVNKIRLILQIYTILHLIIFLILFTNVVKVSYQLLFVIHYLFLLIFISFMWLRLPMATISKVGETILILIFGLFALWMWIPSEKELKIMVSK
jgi:hypothetical protein